MRTLKESIRSYMYKVTFALVSVILVSVLVLSIANEQSRARETADKIFQQMDKILEENGGKNIHRNVFMMQRPLPIYWRRIRKPGMTGMNCARSRNS